MQEHLEDCRAYYSKLIGLPAGCFSFRESFLPAISEILSIWREVVEAWEEGREQRLLISEQLLDRVRGLDLEFEKFHPLRPSDESYYNLLRELKTRRFQGREILTLILPYKLGNRSLITRGYREASDFLVFVIPDFQGLNESEGRNLRGRLRKVKPDAVFIKRDPCWVIWTWIPIEDDCIPCATSYKFL